MIIHLCIPSSATQFLEATAKLPADENDIYSVIADPLLRKALKPEDD